MTSIKERTQFNLNLLCNSLLLLLCIMLTGCWKTPEFLELNTRHFDADSNNPRYSLYETDASKRINIIAELKDEERGEKSFLRYCPEFVPIASKSTVSSQAFDLQIEKLANLGASKSDLAVVSKLQDRSHGNQFYEQGLFSLCIAALNSWVESDPDVSTKACRNAARVYFIKITKGTVTPPSDYPFWVMPDVCVTEYERGVYKLRKAAENILTTEAIFGQKGEVVVDSDLDSIMKILNKRGLILKSLHDETIEKQKEELKKEKEEFEKDEKERKEKLKHDEAISAKKIENAGLETQNAKLKETRDKLETGNNNYTKCLDDGIDPAKCKQHLHK